MGVTIECFSDHGKTLLEYHFSNHNFTKVMQACGFGWEAIDEVFEDGMILRGKRASSFAKYVMEDYLHRLSEEVAEEVEWVNLESKGHRLYLMNEGEVVYFMLVGHLDLEQSMDGVPHVEKTVRAYQAERERVREEKNKEWERRMKRLNSSYSEEEEEEEDWEQEYEEPGLKLEVTDNVMMFVTSLSNVDPTLFDLIWGDPDPDKTLQYDTVVYYWGL